MVEPVDPGQGRPFYCLQALPGLPNHLGLVQPIDGLGQGLGITDRHVLHPVIAMVDQTAPAEMARCCREVPGVHMINLLAGGFTPVLPLAHLTELGYRLAAYPLALLAVTVAAMRTALDELAAGRMPDRQVDFATLRALVGFDAYDRLLDAYATPTVRI